MSDGVRRLRELHDLARQVEDSFDAGLAREVQALALASQFALAGETLAEAVRAWARSERTTRDDNRLIFALGAYEHPPDPIIQLPA